MIGYDLYKYCHHVFIFIEMCPIVIDENTRDTASMNVMLRERFGLGHRSSPARVITKTSCLSDGR